MVYDVSNIEQAVQWMILRSFRVEQVLTEAFVRQLHKRMYGDVWSWAGTFRTTEKNIGIKQWRIGTELRYLLDDTAYWITKQTYPPDEIALRLKHRMVSIHCVPNGNGRHSRLMADILIDKIFKQPVFTWGAFNLAQDGAARSAYLRAVKAADSGDLTPLLQFARS